MSAVPPFSQPGTDLEGAYGSVTDSPAGSYITTIPTNFQRVRSAVLGLHGRLCSVEASLGIAAGAFKLIGGVNEHFQVRRSGPAEIGLATPAAATRALVNSAGFVAPYSGGRLNAAGAGTHEFVHSLAAGWYLARQQFSNIGVEPGTNTRRGLRLTWDLSTFNTSLQPGAGGYATPQFGGDTGDFPGLYQPLTRHLPVEALQGQSLALRLTYDHTAAIPSGVTYNLLISYLDGGQRFDSLSPALAQGAGVLSFATSEDTVTFPGGVIPATATAVEVGLVLGANTALSGTDTWDLLSLEVDVGGTRPSTDDIPPYVADWLQAGMFYAQQLGRDVTGSEKQETGSSGLHPLLGRLIAAGGAAPTVGDAVTFSDRQPWWLAVPWRTAATALVPGCRVSEVYGAVVDVVNALYTTYDLSANESLAVTLANPASVNAAAPYDARGLTTSLDRAILLTVLSGASAALSQLEMPKLSWIGEVHALVSPLGY